MCDTGRILTHMTMTNPTAAVPEWTLGWRMQRALAHAEMTTAEMAEDLGRPYVCGDDPPAHHLRAA